MKIEGMDALSRIGYAEDGARTTWNHRVVRRHSDGATWLELTEVHYRDGAPWTFSLDIGAIASGACSIDDGYNEPQDVENIRETLTLMSAALEKPILDEIADFTADNDPKIE